MAKPWENYQSSSKPTVFADNEEQQKPMSRGRSFVEGAKQGASFGVYDEAMAGLTAGVAAPFSDMTFSEIYEPSVKQLRGEYGQAKKEHGGWTAGGEAAGALATSLGGGALAAKIAPKAAGALKAYGQAKPIRAAAGIGGVSGALYGAGQSEGGIEERLGGAALGGALGAGLGAVAAPVIGAAGNIVGLAANKLAVKTEQKLAAASAKQGGSRVAPINQDKAVGKIIKRLRADYPDDAEYNKMLDQFIADPERGLAEMAGKQTKNLAEGAQQYPSGQTKGTEYIENRLGGAKDRVQKTFSANLSSNRDYYGTLDDLVEKGRERAGPLYDRAYSQNKALASPSIDKILETPAGKQALGTARTKMMNDRSLMGLPDKELGEIARELQSMGLMESTPGGVAAGLNLRSLDYVKRSLDDQINAAYRAGEKDNGRILADLKNSLLKEMDTLDTTGSYAEARKVSGDYLSHSKAMDDGKDFMNRGDAEEIKKFFEKLDPSQKESFKAGMVRNIKDRMDRAVDSADMYKVVFGNQVKRDKLAAVMSRDEFNDLSKALKAEENLYKLRDQILGNSRTAGRQLAAKEFDAEGQKFLQDTVTNGIERAALGKISGWIAKSFDGLGDKSAGRVAELLYEINPEKKLALVKTLRGAHDLTPQEKTRALKAYFSADAAIKKLRPETVGLVSGAESGAMINQQRGSQ